MANDILVLKQKAEEVERNLSNGNWMSKIINDNAEMIKQWNTQSQLYEQGVNRYGVSISSYQPYAQSTIKYKMRKGQPYDRVTLRDSGDFHASFYVETTSTSFSLKASDYKTQWLDKRYTPYIYGITDERVEELTHNYIYPALMDLVKTTL